jgi:hypothetical protein
MNWRERYENVKPGHMFQAVKPFYETTAPLRIFPAKTLVMVINIDRSIDMVEYLVEDIKSDMGAYNFFVCFEEMNNGSTYKSI